MEGVSSSIFDVRSERTKVGGIRLPPEPTTALSSNSSSNSRLSIRVDYLTTLKSEYRHRYFWSGCQKANRGKIGSSNGIGQALGFDRFYLKSQVDEDNVTDYYPEIKETLEFGQRIAEQCIDQNDVANLRALISALEPLRSLQRFSRT